jgi:VIT1/CCC1 family predicted Fe2+/Mn2+ transporter
MYDEKVKKKILEFQKNEITEHFIYKKLAGQVKDPNNKDVLKRIADEELRHYRIWEKYTYQKVRPDIFKLWKYVLMAKVFGLTFAIMLMEKGEISAQNSYNGISNVIPEAEKIEKEENEHEQSLLEMMDEERLRYAGSVVLGLNDALVELTGALAGFTLALREPGLVATAGLITGVAASFSMAAFEYLSTKSESDGKNPVKAAVYTGFAYLATVIVLIFPFLILDAVLLSLAFTLVNAIIVIFAFTYYISIAKNMDFKKRFTEMAAVSLGVAAISFVIGYFIKMFIGIDA